MERYPTPDAKVALVVESARQAKRDTVTISGIGEDLAYTLIGWRGDHLADIAQAQPELMLRSPEDRGVAFSRAAFVFRRGLSCTGLTLLTEGWCSPEPPSGVSLPARFAAGDADVRECLIVTHVEADGTCVVLASPYRYGLGRTVTYDNELFRYEHPESVTFVPLFRQALAAARGDLADHPGLLKSLARTGLSVMSLDPDAWS